MVWAVVVSCQLLLVCCDCWRLLEVLAGEAKNQGTFWQGYVYGRAESGC